jgi:tripartite-type tricarboxylate transporter receptor subunit TctC
MPKAIVTRWNREVAKVLLTEKMKSQMLNEVLEMAAGPPEQFRKFVSQDVAKWRRVIDEAKIARGG